MREERSQDGESDDESSSFFAGCEKAGVPGAPVCASCSKSHSYALTST
jgi:hypothetical protein